MFGQRLRQLRESRGLTPQQAADATGLRSREAIYMIESGRRYPSTRTLHALCRLYAADASQLLAQLNEEREAKKAQEVAA